MNVMLCRSCSQGTPLDALSYNLLCVYVVPGSIAEVTCPKSSRYTLQDDDGDSDDCELREDDDYRL